MSYQLNFIGTKIKIIIFSIDDFQNNKT
jgi:hypothetical protein